MSRKEATTTPTLCQVGSVPPLLLGYIALVPPHAHAIPHDLLDHTSIVCPPWRVVRNLDQRIICLRSLCHNHHILVVIFDLLARPFQELAVYSGRQGPWWPARGSRLVCWELQTY